MSPMELRNQLKEVKKSFGRNEATEQQFIDAADQYISALKDYKKKTKAKISIPNRAYLMRAI